MSISETRIDGAARNEVHRDDSDDSADLRRTVVAGVLGAIVASAGYLIYSRLEDEHKETIRNSVMKFLEEKMREARAQFKL
ncbi:MAG TPA: hypothetical protein VJN22_02630 [Candidatus Eremiobacteraceae bacterium]|nr:hypothetical protein [Candidatus Eremiobacteraceae bacterium]